jgi:4-amino-4-deoxy-L-arabinose transferase-like glycosyltransferase
MNPSDQEKKPLKWILVGLFLLWLAFVLASYYLVQNAYLQPTLDSIRSIEQWISPRLSLASIGRSMLDILVAIWISFVSLGLGRRLTTRISRSRMEPLEALLVGLGLGFGFLAFLILGLGVVGLISMPIFFGLLVLLTLLTGRSSIRFLKGLPLPRPGRLIALFIIVSMALTLTLALLPATSWDGLFYHLTGPKLYLEQGRILSGIDIPHLNFPFLFEMLYLLALTLGREAAPILLHFTFALMLAGLVYLMARQLLKVRNAWFAVLFLLAIPMILSLAGWAYNDLALAFYEVLALYALLKWRRGGIDKAAIQEPSDNTYQDYSWLILSGIMLGLAMGLKYTSIVALFSLALLLIWWYRKEVRKALKPLLLFAGLAFLVASPWLVKNLIFTGNPVYPFVFGGENWDEFRAAAYSEGGTGIAYDAESCTEYSPEFLVGQHPTGCEIDIGTLAARSLLLPFDITLGLRDASQDGPIGPLFLIFLPLIIFYLIARRHELPYAAGGFLFFALTQYAFWTIGVVSSAALWQSRLLIPGLVALCPVLAWILQDLAHLDHPRFSLQRMLYLIIGSVLLVGILIQFINWIPQQPWGYLLGGETEELYLRRRLGHHYEAMQSINTMTPDEAAIAFMWEPRSYYCDRDCQPDSILDEFGHLQHQYGDAQNMVNAMRDEGITHVLIFEKGLDFVLEANSPTDIPLDEPGVLEDLRENYLEPVSVIGEDWYTLYKIADR